MTFSSVVIFSPGPGLGLGRGFGLGNGFGRGLGPGLGRGRGQGRVSKKKTTESINHTGYFLDEYEYSVYLVIKAGNI